jgi:hypothetical protein
MEFAWVWINRTTGRCLVAALVLRCDSIQQKTSDASRKSGHLSFRKASRMYRQILGGRSFVKFEPISLRFATLSLPADAPLGLGRKTFLPLTGRFLGVSWKSYVLCHGSTRPQQFFTCSISASASQTFAESSHVGDAENGSRRHCEVDTDRL